MARKGFPNNSGKRYQPRNYLQQNRGRWLVQVPVPKDLRHLFLTSSGRQKTVIEKYLRTSDRQEAKILAPAAVAAIRQQFGRARQGALTDEEIKAAAQAEIRRTYDFLAENPLDGEELLNGWLFSVQNMGGEGLDYDFLRPRSVKVINQICAEPTEESIRAMSDALVDAAFAAKTMYSKNIQPQRLRGVSVSVEGGLTVIQAMEAYVVDRSVTSTEKTKAQLMQTVRLFADHVGRSTSVAAIDGRAAVAFLDRLSGIRANYRYDKHAAKMSLDELEKKYSAGHGRGLSAATLNRHATNLRVLFSWLIDREELPFDHRNPFDRKSRKVTSIDVGGDSAGYLPATDDEIATLLGGASLSTRPSRKFNDQIGWIIALAVYTGTRAGELVALTTADVLKKDGIDFIVIPKGKTENARRNIPVHPVLIAAGFLDYVAAREGPLFDVNAKSLSKRFKPYRENLGVTRDRVTFHSLRKSFATKLEHADVSADTAAMLLGHSGMRSFSYDVYSPHGPTLKQLTIAVCRIKYEGVE